MQNYVPLVFIGRDAAVTGVTALSSTVAGGGGIVILNKNYVPLTAGATVSSDPYIHLAQFSATANDHFISPRIYGNQVTSWSGTSYTAPVAQISYIGNIGSGTADIEVNPVADYTVTVIDESDTDNFFNYKRYSYRSTAADTNDTIADGIVTAVNNDDDAIVTAAKVTNGAYRGVSLTIDDASKVFTCGVDGTGGFGATAVTDPSTNPVRGSGTYAQVTELESFSKGTRGHMNRVWHPFSFPTYAVDGATYDLYNMTYYNQIESNQPGVVYNQAPCMVTVAMPVPSTWGQANFESTMNTWLASSTGAFAAVTL